MKLKDHPSSVQPQATASIKFRRRAGETASPCIVCGSSVKSDFNVPDDVWKRVVPSKYWNKVVCFECFGNFACEKQIELFAGAAQKWRGLITFCSLLLRFTLWLDSPLEF